MKTKCLFSDVSEHDMDMLIMEEFACSETFVKIFTDLIQENPLQVLSIQSSKTEIGLGETDITVILNCSDRKIGLLIEDKIDAIAMPAQSDRYVLRGNAGVERGDYDEYYVFIIAPEKYLSQNIEAQKYPFKVKYEQLLEYFGSINDNRSTFKIQQISQAIEKQKKGYQVSVDVKVTDFWAKYSDYQKEHYPDLYLIYNNDVKGSNATWPRFNTVIKGLFMYHKTENGYVDLEFSQCADRIVNIESYLKEIIGDYIQLGFTVQRTGRSAAVRLIVPKLDMQESFEAQILKVNECFDAIKRMSDLVRRFSTEVVTTLIN